MSYEIPNDCPEKVDTEGSSANLSHELHSIEPDKSIKHEVFADEYFFVRRDGEIKVLAEQICNLQIEQD